MIKKIIISLITILIAMTFTFCLIRQMPGDILHNWALQIQLQQGISYDEAKKIATTMMNYDPSVPIYIQYVKYMGNLLFHGNLGYSLTYRIPVFTIIKMALPWTIFITILSVTFSFTIGVFLGTMIAWKRKTILEPIVTFYATVTQAIPDFLLGLILIAIFGVTLRWFPIRGACSPDVTPGFNMSFIINILYYAILPVMAFSLQSIRGWALAMKASAVSVLGEDYINVARAKGLTQWRIMTQYLGKNAIIPLVSNLAITLGNMLGGCMLVESIFGYPGIGYFLGQAIATRDYTLIQGLFLITTVAIVLANLIADIVYTKLDPRIKLE